MADAVLAEHLRTIAGFTDAEFAQARNLPAVRAYLNEAADRLDHWSDTVECPECGLCWVRAEEDDNESDPCPRCELHVAWFRVEESGDLTAASARTLESSACQLDDGRWVCSRECWERAARMWDEAPAVGTETVAWRWRRSDKDGSWVGPWVLLGSEPKSDPMYLNEVQPLGVIGAPTEQLQPEGKAEHFADLLDHLVRPAALGTREPGAPTVEACGHRWTAPLDGRERTCVLPHTHGYHEAADKARCTPSEMPQIAAHAALTAAGVPAGTLVERVEHLHGMYEASQADGDLLAGKVARLDRLLAQRATEPAGEQHVAYMTDAGLAHLRARRMSQTNLWGEREAPHRVFIIVPPEGRSEGEEDGNARVGAAVDPAGYGAMVDTLGPRVAPAGVGEESYDCYLSGRGMSDLRAGQEFTVWPKSQRLRTAHPVRVTVLAPPATEAR